MTIRQTKKEEKAIELVLHQAELFTSNVGGHSVTLGSANG
jgi:hypothetical protein